MKQTPVPGRLAAVAEHHLDDVHRRAEVVGDVVRPAVDLRARRVPRVEHGAVRAAELLAGVGRKRAAGLRLVDRRERLDELAEVVRREIDVLRDPARGLEIGQRLLEAVAVDAVDDLAEHLDQAAVRVEGEARVPGRGGEPLGRGVVQAEVEDRVHHPGHRDRGARADGDEQRVARDRRSACRFAPRARRCAPRSRRRAPPAPVPPAAMYARHASVVTVNPAGTGIPSWVISARPTPFPPRSSRPPPESSSKSKT